MKSSLEHLPEKKQRELARVVEIIHEEFEDAMRGGEADFKKKGRIWKIILFGSYARGTWVDEPHTSKGYRSDYDILIIVSTKKLTEAEFWYASKDRLMRDRGIKTPVGVIVHSRREVGDALHTGQHFFSDIRQDGVVLYEINDDPLPVPKRMSPDEAYLLAKVQFEKRFPTALSFVDTYNFLMQKSQFSHAAFELHQAIEQTYSALLLTLTNYAPASHHIGFLRALAEERDMRLADVWPRDRQRFVAWFNLINEAYVKARYSAHYNITEEALVWLGQQTAHLQRLVEISCREHLDQLRANA